MDPQSLFPLVFPLAVPFWLLMIFLPGWSVTRRVVSSPLIAVPPLLVYLTVLLADPGPFVSAVTSASYPDLVRVLGTPTGTVAIWAHLIAFDLLVGRWMYLEARDRAVPALLMAPILVLTVLLSPIGFLVFLGVRAGRPAGRPARAGALDERSVS
jgi:hypothetical protein